MPRTDRRGFTVLELLCSLGIVSVLFAIALPRVSAVLPGLLLDQAARQLVSEVELVRVKAINRNNRVRILFDLDRAQYRIENEVEGRFEPEGEPRRLPPGIAFDASACTRVADGRVTITLLPRGHTFDNATIALAAAEGNRRRVIVGSAGRVRLE
jgi:prepilin-type N-terminal cleavage/methylation domain-containing protein